MPKVLYTPSHAKGSYPMTLTDSQWEKLKVNPDYQLATEPVTPAGAIEVDGKEYVPVPEPPSAVTAEQKATET